MRDPARIPRILKKIQRYWYEFPELDLTQLLQSNWTDEELEKEIDKKYNKVLGLRSK